jgi:ABC-2 type transport system ATP-binding protein
VLDEPFTGLDPLVRDELIEGLLARAEGTTNFISSHDLGEMESFASHVGYLDAGKLRLSEELETLSARVREVVMTFDSPPERPREMPAHWMHLDIAGNVVRFVETQYDERAIADLARRVFPTHREMEVNGMPLRSIFVALAKKGRDA